MEEGPGSPFWSKLSHLFRASKADESIEDAIQEAKEEGELQADEESMLLNVLRLSEQQVLEIMVPRTDIVCAEEDEDIAEVVEKFIESGHSRMPVFQDNRDNITGIIYAKDLLKALASDSETRALKNYVRDPMFVPETKNVLEMLQVFRMRRAHMAIALDEYGGTSGLVTLEDVIEEIVGEIEDEHDEPQPENIQPLEDGTFLVSGRTPLYDLEDGIGLKLESDLVETLGGYLSELAGRVPKEGDQFRDEGFLITVKEADSKHVEWIVIEKAG